MADPKSTPQQDPESPQAPPSSPGGVTVGSPEPVKPEKQAGAEELERAAAGQTLNGKEERSGLDWLLGATTALQYNVPVEFETPDGMRRLRFRIHQVDDRKMQELDEANRKGDGPFAKLDTTSYNAALVAEATIHIEDEAGEQVEPASARFMGGVPSLPLAFELRFKYQPGLLEGVGEVIGKVSGRSPDRVGTAQRVLVEAVGNS